MPVDPSERYGLVQYVADVARELAEVQMYVAAAAGGGYLYDTGMILHTRMLRDAAQKLLQQVVQDAGD